MSRILLCKVAIVGIMCLIPSLLWAACIEDGIGGYNCTGISNNSDSQTGKTILDNSSGNVVLTNDIMPPGAELYVDNIINNDYTQPNVGPISVIRATGGIGSVTVNNGAVIEMLRGYRPFPETNEVTMVNPTTIAFSATADGQLLNHGVQAGIDAAIYTDAATSLLTVNNGLGGLGFLLADGNLSSGIFSNSAQVIINQLEGGRITNASYYADPASAHNNGYWAVATYGEGKTTINNTFMIGDEVYSATIGGNVYVVDRNPLLELAQRRDPSLVLAYGPEDVGPRDSEINGQIEGDLYLGSGAHILNGSAVNIYVDQRGADVVDVSGGVANTLYTVSGARTFTLNSFGQAPETININDVVGAVNTLNINDKPGGPINILTNGLGTNILNLGCSSELTNPCSTGGTWTGLTSVSFIGTSWNITEGSVISLASGNVDINSQRFQLELNSELSADNILVRKNTMLFGHLDFETALTPPSTNDSIGSLTGHLVNNGHIYLRNAELTVNGDADFNDGSLLSLRITPNGNGKVNIVGGNGNFSDGAILDVSFRNKFFRSGEIYTVATNSNGTPIIQTSSGMVNFTSNDNSGDLTLIANVAIPDEINPTAAGKNAVMSLMNYSGNNAAIANLQVQIQGLSEEELQRATERLRPEINDSNVRMLMQHTDSVLGLVDTHLFETHLADIKGEPRVRINGEMPMGAGVWFQGIGASGTQDKRGNVDGYKLSSTGMAAGVDRLVGDADDSLRVGFAGAYAYGNIDNSNLTDNNRSNVNSYLGTAYASWAPDVWYLNAAVGLARHTFDTHRVALAYGNDSNHAAWQLMGKVDAGWPISYNDLLTFVPQANFSYSHIDEEGYSETGSQSYNNGTFLSGVLDTSTVTSPTLLSIKGKSYDSYRAGLGGKVLLSLQEKDYNAGVELRAHVMHELGDIANNSNARFVAGGVSFYSPGMKPDRDAVLLGSSVRLTGNDDNDQLTLLASYDADIRNKYFGQTFSMMLRYDFDQSPSYLKKAEYRRTAAVNRQQATTINVKATEQDVSQISQAMKPSALSQIVKEDMNSADPEVRKNAQKQQAVISSIDLWIQSIINSNLQTYLNSYSADFVNEEGMSRRQWENKRRLEMKAGGKPNLKIADMQIKTDGSRAAAIFAQALEIENRLEVVQKIVELEERNGRWLIVSEDTVPSK